MKNLILFITLTTSFVFFTSNLLAVGSGTTPTVPSCPEATPICSDASSSDLTFQNSTNTSVPNGPNYGCLNDPNLMGMSNPQWYYFKVSESGDLKFKLSQQNNNGTGIDCDFAMWGPYNDLDEACNEVMSGSAPPIQCSSDPDDVETIGLGVQGGGNYWANQFPGSIDGTSTPPPGEEGQYYLIIVTNADGQSGTISLEQTGGEGSTDCSITVPCSIEVTATPSACDEATNTFSVSGEVTFSDEPETGQLVIEDCNGNSVTYDVADISSPWEYEIIGIDSDGSNCSITAYFSDETACEAVKSFQSPEGCQCEVPDVTITDLQSCTESQLDLMDAVETSSGTTITFYTSENDAQNKINDTGSTVNSSGTYWVRVENADDASCYTIKEIKVSLGEVNFSIDKNDPSCGGDCDGSIVVNVSGSGQYLYKWTNEGGDVIGNEKELNNLCGGIYGVEVTDEVGCSSSESVQLIQPEEVDASFSATDFCEGNANQITDFVTPGGTFTFGVEPNDGAIINPSTGEISNGVAGTTYTVQHEVSNGDCVDTSTEEITVLEGTIPSFEVDFPMGCEPHTVTFINTSNPAAGSTCTWKFGDGSEVQDCAQFVTHTYTQAGVFDVTLSIDDVGGCSGTQTEKDFIHVIEKPKANFIADPMVTNTDHTEITFENISEGATGYTWDFGDGSPQENTEDAIHIYEEEEGGYLVSLIAANGDCADTMIVVIKIEEDLLFYIPNTFTPDGDSYNQYFQPVFTAGFDPFDFEMIIYNRWGETLFETHNAEIGWDGTYGTQMAKDGMYLWKIEVKEKKSDERRTFTGHITLIR